jgi:hypothetical protein
MKRKTHTSNLKPPISKELKMQLSNELSRLSSVAQHDIINKFIKYYYDELYNKEKPDHTILYDAYKSIQHRASIKMEEITTAFAEIQKGRSSSEPSSEDKRKAAVEAEDRETLQNCIRRAETIAEHMQGQSPPLEDLRNLIWLLEIILAQCHGMLGGKNKPPEHRSPKHRSPNKKSSRTPLSEGGIRLKLEKKANSLLVKIQECSIQSALKKPKSIHTPAKSKPQSALFKEKKPSVAETQGQEWYGKYKESTKKCETYSFLWKSKQTLEEIQEIDKFWEGLKKGLQDTLAYTKGILSKINPALPKDIKDLIDSTESKFRKWKMESELCRLMNMAAPEWLLPKSEIAALCGCLDYITLWEMPLQKTLSLSFR